MRAKNHTTAISEWKMPISNSAADVGAARGLTLAMRANSGRWRDSRNELPRWNKAGGRIVQRLVNRRADEQRLCLSTLGKD